MEFVCWNIGSFSMNIFFSVPANSVGCPTLSLVLLIPWIVMYDWFYVTFATGVFEKHGRYELARTYGSLSCKENFMTCLGMFVTSKICYFDCLNSHLTWTVRVSILSCSPRLNLSFGIFHFFFMFLLYTAMVWLDVFTTLFLPPFYSWRVCTLKDYCKWAIYVQHITFFLKHLPILYNILHTLELKREFAA